MEVRREFGGFFGSFAFQLRLAESESRSTSAVYNFQRTRECCASAYCALCIARYVLCVAYCALCVACYAVRCALWVAGDVFYVLSVSARELVFRDLCGSLRIFEQRIFEGVYADL